MSAKIIEFKSKFESASSSPSNVLKAARAKNKTNKAPSQPKKEIKPFNYVLVNKKRDFESTCDEELNKKSIDAQAELQEIQTLNKKMKSLAEFNIIDLVSSEYFTENDSSKRETKSKTQENVPSPSKITCNGVEMIREKVIKQEEQFVYDIYFTKNTDLHLDLLYSNSYEIKSSNNYDNIELVDEKCLKDDEEEGYFFK